MFSAGRVLLKPKHHLYGKTPKITNKQMLLRTRREPHKPQTGDRHAIEDRASLEAFESRCAEGVAFVPDSELPPWKRGLALNLKRKGTSMNFRGFRVRAVDKQDEPGFPTHFR